jgi:hypothetical protein
MVGLGGNEQSSPDENISQFFGDAAIDEFLSADSNRLSAEQADAGGKLRDLMRRCADETPSHLEAADVIDDPRWGRIRDAAGAFLLSMSARRKNQLAPVDQTRDDIGLPAR